MLSLRMKKVAVGCITSSAPFGRDKIKGGRNNIDSYVH